MNEESLRLSEERRNEIEANVEKTPLTSRRLPIIDLEKQYKSGSWRDSLSSLQQHFGHMRQIRGDGNCYYRAFLYSVSEKILMKECDDDEKDRITKFVKDVSWEKVKEAGYDQMTIEVFYDEMVELLEAISSGSLDEDSLREKLNEENATSNYCTWYLRVVTATHLKLDPERFLPFIEPPGQTVDEFCKREVEPMGKECEQLQILALAEAFGVQVQIEYMDGRELVNGSLARHTFGNEQAKIKLAFLYRPGHYDILYP